MKRPIPEQIVAAVTALAESLTRWCEAGRDGRLEQHETAVLERVRAVLPQVLAAVVEVATSALAPRVRGARAACPSCGRRVKPHQERPRQVLTRGGAVTRERPWYTCARCHRGWSVVETTLGVGSRQRSSPGLLAWLVRLGATTDYREAAELLEELTGLAVAPETIRRECVRVGAAIRAAEAWAIQQTQRTREAADPPAPGLLVLEADGAMILFTDGWHEVQIGMVAGWDGDRLVPPSSVAAREPSTAFGPRLAAFDRLTPPTPKAAETRRVDRTSFASRVDRMDYPSLRLDGLPLGSGAIESAADHVVQRRMKRAGRRWSDSGGDAILARLRSRRKLAA